MFYGIYYACSFYVINHSVELKMDGKIVNVFLIKTFFPSVTQCDVAPYKFSIIRWVSFNFCAGFTGAFY